MNQLIISRMFTLEEYFLFSRGGACPQDGWTNDETGEPVDAPAIDNLVEWDTDYGECAAIEDIDIWPVKVMGCA